MTAPSGYRSCACGHPLWLHSIPKQRNPEPGQPCRQAYCNCNAFTAQGKAS